jgi:hypothetical protein
MRYGTVPIVLVQGRPWRVRPIAGMTKLGVLDGDTQHRGGPDVHSQQLWLQGRWAAAPGTNRLDPRHDLATSGAA